MHLGVRETLPSRTGLVNRGRPGVLYGRVPCNRHSTRSSEPGTLPPEHRIGTNPTRVSSRRRGGPLMQGGPTDPHFSASSGCGRRSAHGGPSVPGLAPSDAEFSYAPGIPMRPASSRRGTTMPLATKAGGERRAELRVRQGSSERVRRYLSGSTQPFEMTHYVLPLPTLFGVSPTACRLGQDRSGNPLK